MTTNENPSTFISGWHRFSPDEEKVLCADEARRHKANDLLKFAILWNTLLILSTIMMMMMMMNARDRFFKSGWVLMVPFALIGAWILAYAMNLHLKTRNPSLTLRVSGQGAYAGDPLELSWKFSGRVDRIKRLEIYIEGREIATSNRGTTDTTHTKPFMRIPVFESEIFVEIESGRATADLSKVAMPTFVSIDNQIRYFLCLKGEIPNWPDIDDEFEIDIWPANAKEVQS